MSERRDNHPGGIFRAGQYLSSLIILILLFAAGCAPRSTAAPTGAAAPATPASTTIPQAAKPAVSGDSLLPILQSGQPLRFDHLTPEAGLSQSVVTDFIQDDQGFLWLATQDGLNRYDGNGFKIFKEDLENPGSMRGNFASSLEKDASGAIWIGANDGGLNRYDPQTGLFTSYQNDPANPNSLSENSVSSLVVDRQGNIWAGTNNSGVNRLDPQTGSFSRYLADPEEPNSLSSNNISSLQLDPSGDIWIGTLGGGLNRLDPATGKVVRYQYDPDDPNSLSDAFVQTLYIDRQGILWVGTFTGGLNRFDPQSETFVRYQNDPSDPTSLAHNSAAAIFEDRNGDLWIGTQGGGLNLFDRQAGRFTRYQNNPMDANSLGNDYVVSIYEDKSGILWLGTFGSGADFYDPLKNKFALLRSQPENPNSLSVNSIWAIYQDQGGSLWIGTNGGGLDRYYPQTGEWRHYLNDPDDSNSLNSNVVMAIYQDAQGILWLATATGLNRFDPETEVFTYYQTPYVIDILQDHLGNLWLGTAQGLFLFDPEREVVANTYLSDPNDPTSLSSNAVSTLYEDAQRNLWVGTLNGGLNLFDRETERFTHYMRTHYMRDPSRRGSISSNVILSIYQSQAGTLWVGTGGGINRFDPETASFGALREKDGLPNDTVYGILEDGQGYLWLSTNKGVSRFDPQALTFKNYDSSDGLQGPEFNQGAYYENPEGVMFFGGVNGLNAFHPDLVQDNAFIPPVVITDFRIFHKPVPVGPDSPLQKPIEASREINLSYTDDFFEFEFAALHYSSPQEIQYAYQMENLDQDWNYVEGIRFASYTNVPPGEYTFRVKATNSDGVWNEDGAALHILIPPPFWQTAWFRLLAALALVGGISAVFVARLRSVEMQRRRLEIQVEQRTHELHQAMIELEQSKEAAEAANRAKSTFLANMSHEFRTPLNAILGFTQIMIRDRSLSGDVRENIDVIHRSSEHLLGLINDVLEISKIEAGRVTLNPRSFDLPRMLTGLYEMFALRAESKGLTLKLDLAPDLPRYIQSDEGKLRQVLMNLLGNAVKFTQQGHVILRVHPGLPPEGSSSKPAWICFAVDDTGPGISPQDLAILFTPFVQTSAGQQSSEGTGLGLPISQQFVRLMGGEIQVSSQEGNGSIFKFSLPVEIVHASDLEKPPPCQRVVGLEAGQPIYRLLVVDDQEVNRRLLVKLFAPLGFDVRAAVNGKEAIEIWQAWEPHLILMDMRMPVMDGYEATRRIKTTTRGMATVIIALTASALEEDRAVILSEGCDDYIRKPFHEDDLFTTVAKYLGVKYVYEEIEPAATAEIGLAGSLAGISDESMQEIARRLRELDLDWLADLEHATILGDQQAILQIAGQAVDQDTALAEAITRLADQFEHDRILALIQLAREAGEDAAAR